MARRRHLSRVAVLRVLFECEKRPTTDPLEAFERAKAELKEEGGLDEDFALELLTGVLEKKTNIEDALASHAPGWSLERMDPISRGVLRIGAYELLLAGDAPPAVVMNEAIDIAKEYGTEEAGKFVNGVLNAIAQKLKT